MFLMTAGLFPLEVSQSFSSLLLAPPPLFATLLTPTATVFFISTLERSASTQGPKSTFTPFEQFATGGNSAMLVVFTELSCTAIDAKRGTPSGIETGDLGVATT